MTPAVLKTRNVPLRGAPRFDAGGALPGTTMTFTVARCGNSVRRLVTTLLLAASVFANQVSAEDTPGRPLTGSKGNTETTASIMARAAVAPPTAVRLELQLQYPDRSLLPDNPAAPSVASTPPDSTPKRGDTRKATTSHTTALSFDAVTLADTGAFPPDSMGTVGPTQFIAAANGRIRSFTKNGVADGVLSVSPDAFFASVMTPVAGSVVLNFTSDPQIRYDRFTGRWYVSIIDVPCTNATCTTTAPNRWLLAVSDAASNGTISASTVWTFFQFQASPGTDFCDYPSLGVDVNALYVGCNMFSSAGSFVGTNGYVVRKSSILGAGPITTTMSPIWRQVPVLARFLLVASTTTTPLPPKATSSALTMPRSHSSRFVASRIRALDRPPSLPTSV